MGRFGILLLAVCGLMTFATAYPTASLAGYSFSDLGTLGGSAAIATGINDQGQAVGYSSTPTSADNPFLWLPEAAYGLPAGMNNIGASSDFLSDAWGINNLGQIVGWARTTPNAVQHLTLRLPEPAYGLPAGINALPVHNYQIVTGLTAINIKGQIASAYYAPDGRHRIGFVWLPEPDYGFPAGLIDVGSFGGVRTRADDINASGQVAGESLMPNGDPRAFVWLPTPAFGLGQGMHEIGTLGGLRSSGIGINDLGQIVGNSTTPGGQSHAFLWLPQADYGLPAGMNDLGTLGGADSSAIAINNLGQIVGGSNTANEGQQHAFIWLPKRAYGLPAGMSDLSNLLDKDPLTLRDINSSGQIAGYWHNEDGETDAVLLTPEVEPAHLVLTKSASAALALPGSIVTFRIDLSNAGLDPVQDVTIEDSISPELTILACRATGEGICTVAGSLVRVQYPSVGPNENETASITAIVGPLVRAGTTISNTAAVTSSNPQPAEPVQASASLFVGYAPQLGLNLVSYLLDGDPTPKPGTSGDWTLAIAIQARTRCYGIQVAGAINPSFSIRGLSATQGKTSAASGGAVAWSVTSLSAGQTAVMKVLVHGRVPYSAFCPFALSSEWMATYYSFGPKQTAGPAPPVVLSVR